MKHRALVNVSAVLAVGVAGSLLAVAPASASAGSADIAVEVVAERNILPVMGWSLLDVHVRNLGSEPAENVTVTLELPPELRTSSTESNSAWDCDFETPVMRCTHVGNFPPGTESLAIRRTVGVEGAQPGAELMASGSVTTSSPEASTANNTATRAIRIVDSGMVKGRLWNDLNADGVRQADEPPVESVGLSIRSQDDDDQYGFSNNFGGQYQQTVPAKRYKVETGLFRFAWRFTTPDVGSDDTDSDLRPTTETPNFRYGASDVITVAPSTPTVVDLGVVAAFRPTRIAPICAPQGRTAVLTLSGEAFATSMKVQLTRAGSAPIDGTIQAVTNNRTSMTVSFPLQRAVLGTWTVVVETVAARAEVANAFTITRR